MKKNEVIWKANQIKWPYSNPKYLNFKVLWRRFCIIINMSELETLTKTLIHVVGSLQELISKKGGAHGNLEPERPKLKKTPEMTYN